MLWGDGVDGSGGGEQDLDIRGDCEARFSYYLVINVSRSSVNISSLPDYHGCAMSSGWKWDMVVLEWQF